MIEPAHCDVPNLDVVQIRLLVLLDVHIDGEMGVDIAHLVLEAFGDTNDEVVDDGLDCAESGHVLARAMVKFDIHDSLRGL